MTDDTAQHGDSPQPGGRSRPHVKLWLGRVACVAASFLLCAVAIEGVFRLVGVEPGMHDRGDQVTGHFWVCDPHFGFRNRPATCFRHEQVKGSPSVTTIQSGYRNGVNGDPAVVPPEVLFIGDSTTFCAETADDQTGPSEVAKLLKPGPVGVLNAGVRAYNTLQCKRMLEECLAQFSTIEVAVYVYCWNDISENLVDHVHYPAKSPTVRFDETTGQLVEVEVAEPTVPWGQDFKTIWHELRQKKLAERDRRKRWDQLLRNRMRERSVLFHFVHTRLGFLKDRLTGAIPRLDTEPTERKANPFVADPTAGRRELVCLLRQMQRLCDDKDVAFLVTSFTTGRELDWEIRDLCGTAGVRFVSARSDFTESPETYWAPLRNGGYDTHYGPKGTRTFARALAPAVQAELDWKERCRDE